MISAVDDSIELRSSRACRDPRAVSPAVSSSTNGSLRGAIPNAYETASRSDDGVNGRRALAPRLPIATIALITERSCGPVRGIGEGRVSNIVTPPADAASTTSLLLVRYDNDLRRPSRVSNVADVPPSQSQQP